MKNMSLFIFLSMFYASLAIDSKNDIQNDYSDYNEKIYEKYTKLDMQMKNLAEQTVKKILPLLIEAREHVNISANCTRNLFDLIAGFRRLTGWSFNFIDSMGKLQSGIQAGNLQMFGEYQECIDTMVIKKGKVDFQGQYCSISCKPYLPKLKKVPALNERIEGLENATRNSSDVMKLLVSKAQLFYSGEIKLGVCAPSGCSNHDVSEIVKYALGEYVNTTVIYCLKKGDLYFWTIKRTIIVSIFVCLGIVVLISTCLDNYMESWRNNNIGIKSKIFQCFSLTRNFPKLMNTDISAKSIRCLHGIRVLTIFWIILGHEYIIHSITLTTNHGTNYLKMLNNFFSQIILNGFYSVEVFFFISGFVNSYTRMLIKKENKPQPSILTIIIHRLWRIYPAYIAVLLLMYILSKPQANHYQIQHFIQNCDQYWWRNILFISNFFDPFKMCMPQSWYLCVDMQLFVLSLITVPFLLKNPKKGIILHVSGILIANFCTMPWWFVDKIAPSTLDGARLNPSEAAKSYQISASAPVHIGPYFIGILLGYLIASKKEIKIPKIIEVFVWLVASLFFTSMLFMTLRWNSGTPYTHLESSFYGAWSRTVMILGFSWLVYCCITGRAKLINYILSLKLWIPLSRLVYMIYLVSLFLQGHYRLQLNFPDDFTDIKIIWTYFADLSISVLLSLALVLIVESPVIAMEKILFGKNEINNKTSLELPKESFHNTNKENGLNESGKFATIHL